MPDIDLRKPGLAGVLMPGGFQYGLTPLGQQLASQNAAAPQMTSGGNYTFDWNQVGKNPTIAVNNNGESNANNQEANPTWQQFTAADGTPLIAAQGANGLEVQKAIDLGGTGFSGQKLSKMNGLAYDVYGPDGAFKEKGVRSGYADENIGDALGVASIFAMAAAGGALTAAGTEAGVGAGGAAALETASEGFGPAFEASVANGAASTLGAGAVETASEGFGPEFESSVLRGVAPTAPGTFSPAADSQLASEQLGISGPQAAADAAAAPIPSVTVNGAPGGVLDGITDSVTKAAKSPLGNYLLRSGVSALLSTLGGKAIAGSSRNGAGGSATTTPATPAPTTMPDPLAQIRSAQNSVIDQLARRGRESTVLTRTH